MLITGNGNQAAITSQDDGRIKNLPHLADLVQKAIGQQSPRALGEFERAIHGYAEAVKTGYIGTTSEKFDGSPAIRIEVGSDGVVRVGYKTASTSKMFADESDVQAGCADRPDLANIYSVLVSRVVPALRESGALSDLHGRGVQADVLFFTKRQPSEDGTIHLKPNFRAYHIAPNDPRYKDVQSAHVGIVIHTPISIPGSSADVDDSVGRFVSALSRAGDVFAIDPFREGGQLNNQSALDHAGLVARLESIRQRLETLPYPFREVWAAALPHMIVFFNSSLRDGRDGGIHRCVADRVPVNCGKIVDEMLDFLVTREAVSHPLMQRVLGCDRQHLERAVGVYADALRCQSEIMEALAPIFKSKLGGGPVEGIVVHDGGGHAVAKMVDRLEFTIGNFALHPLGTPSNGSIPEQTVRTIEALPCEHASSNLSELIPPERISRWSTFDLQHGFGLVVGKYQPFTLGHARLVSAVVALHKPGEDHPLLVIASATPPKFDCAKPSEFRESVKDLKERRYTYPFTPETRRDLMEESLDPVLQEHPFVRLVMVPVQVVWGSIGGAARSESRPTVRFYIGNKEGREKRYASEFERYSSVVQPHGVRMQGRSISGTEVRAAIRRVAIDGDLEAVSYLVKVGLKAVASVVRRRDFVDRLVSEYKAYDAYAQRVLEDAALRRRKGKEES